MVPGALVWVEFLKIQVSNRLSVIQQTQHLLNFHFLLSNIQKGFYSVPSKADAAQHPLCTQSSSASSFVPTMFKYNKMKTWVAKNSKS